MVDDSYSRDHSFWQDVSRETLQKLEVYEALLKKWQKSLNLISGSTLDSIWDRHFLDSAQLFPHVKDYNTIACLGSGAGFPGAVLAVLGLKKVTLIERDQKKAIFLRTLSRELGVPFTVLNDDIRNINDAFDCIVSRALAPVADLLDLSKSIRTPESTCFFLKGSQANQELAAAQEIWGMTTEIIPSITNKEGCILKISSIYTI